MSGIIILLELSQRIRDEQRDNLRVLRRRLRDDQNPFEITIDEHFIDLYRLPKALGLELINELMPFMPNSQRRHAVPSHVIILSALRFFATGSFQRSVGQDSLSALSQTSVSRCVQVVATALNNIQLAELSRSFMRRVSAIFGFWVIVATHYSLG
ncbi:PREDICTED: uncharacterized protein LOC108359615 [Rhagoletis zephyria]|uniref:uncharacterized protein LOC108359615 n=1 Tax=Rhagoletis zephyria TaxID=28612 RepID=UPI0008119DCF|nr:PREDICTED: uncharacterized protein LOC108359615 [Rhagoletis zephyria]